MEKALLTLFSSLSEAKTSSSGIASSDADAAIRALHEKLDGPSGVVRYLLPRMWMPTVADHGRPHDSGAMWGDDALSILSLLVECRPAEYMAIAASAVRRDIERDRCFRSNGRKQQCHL